MDEKDLELQRLRRDLEQYKDFVEWLQDVAFGVDQYSTLLAEYCEDKGVIWIDPQLNINGSNKRD